MPIQRSLFTLALLILVSLASLPAAEENTDQWIKTTTQSLKTIEKEFETKPELQTDDNLLKELTQIKGKAQACVDESTEALKKTSVKLEALGQPAAGESAEVMEKRAALQKEQRILDKRLNACNLLLIQSGDLIDTINKQHAEALAKELFHRDPGLISVLRKNLLQPTAWWQPGLAYLVDNSGLEKLSFPQLFILLALLTVGLLLGIFLKRPLRTKLSQLVGKDIYSPFSLALRSCLLRYSVILLPLVFAAGFLMLSDQPLKDSFFSVAVSSAIVYFLLLAVIHAVFAPCKPADYHLSEPPPLSRKFSRRLVSALTITWLGYLFFATGLKAAFPEHAYFLIRSTFLVLLVINLIIILWLARRFSWSIFPNGLRILATAGLIVAVLADFAGYKNFSRYLLGGVTGSMLMLVITVRMNRLGGEFFDQLDAGKTNWQKKIRRAMGLKAGEHMPGIVWLRLLVFISFWTLFALVIMRLWGWSQQGEALILERLTQGFEIGTIRIIPGRLLLAILIFAVILSLSRLIKQNLSKRWIKHTNLDRGAQEAMVTITGYVGFVFALMIALSVAGVEFKNVAIVAGALSVGIGFGLQNIVNNFVSGLILLFERPIRRGDWIVVGNTEGYVKSINIRSTEIQTFDRADVIVPNSELISSQVTNWMLRDATGRVVLPVSVAYGTDTEQVKALLLKIANDHPDVITDSSFIPAPTVLFRRFGDSALEFELRCYIHNIDRRLVTISDLNFAVDKTFREAGIEIPFPQRDIHIIDRRNQHDQNQP